MEEFLTRKPLTRAELDEPPCAVCVTGAAGFIASAIVSRLLAAGHTVHATYRKSSDASTVAALKSLPGAAERLRWFIADLQDAASFLPALQGCKYLIHTASPVKMDVPPSQAFPRVVTPAVKGVHNVLAAANKAGSVERVVLTSSIVACKGGRHLQDPSHVVTEADWNTDFGIELPYFMSKTVAEWEAWAMAAQQSRWSLVTILPAITLGPPLAASRSSEAVVTAKKMLDGSSWPFVPPMDFPYIDVADVAAAHCIAMVTPGASGRYILCESTHCLTEVTQLSRRLFPKLWLPFIRLPFWMTAAVSKLTGVLPYAWLKEVYGRKTRYSSAKALRELPGLTPFIPLERCLRDTVGSLVALGMLPAAAAEPAAAAQPRKGAAEAAGKQGQKVAAGVSTG